MSKCSADEYIVLGHEKQLYANDAARKSRSQNFIQETDFKVIE